MDELVEHYRILWFHSIFEKQDQAFRVFFQELNFRQFVGPNRASILTLLEDSTVQTALTEYLTSIAFEFIFEHYQFLQLDEHAESALRKIHADFMRQIHRLLSDFQSLPTFQSGLKEMLRAHFKELDEFIWNRFARTGDSTSPEKKQIHSAMCHEYSPELQLSILKIDVGRLMEPILDIGCGKSGKLVKFLSAKGLKVVGVDRMVESSEMFVQSEWLNYRLTRNFWGTIIAHMSFSNHFIFHHLYRYGVPEKYAQRYMEILASLKKGGQFIYSPGLPFIEKYLPPSKFALQKFNVELPDSYSNKMHRLVDENIFYTCHAQKVDQ
jgi:2-polyprenyl-3-methyl-5-hydroxy-6-metoxy-1,4-benzoquinol methylase